MQPNCEMLEFHPVVVVVMPKSFTRLSENLPILDGLHLDPACMGANNVIVGLYLKSLCLNRLPHVLRPGN